MGTSLHNRRAKLYRLTDTGRRRLHRESEDWNRLVGIMASALEGKA
jgi:DNA-binding PadR family transcriptional regulator